MKLFHVHLHVSDLNQSINFYSKLFAASPTRIESDYAKWMLEDPPLNFAISTRGETVGIDHLGIQTDNEQELLALKQRAQTADMTLLDEGATTCCYARSEKHWVTDPQGIAWEHFHTLSDIPVFREKRDETTAGACCASKESPTSAASPCCTPAKSVNDSCCEAPSTEASPACCAPTADEPISSNRCC